jgi:nucleoid-associated protein YgaU
MIRPAMARKFGRYLAPIALVAVIIATLLVVRAGLGRSHHSSPSRRRDHAVASADTAPRKVFYVIKAGDSLSTISVKTGVSVPALEALNPAVDPNALQTGQRLRLRR